MALKNFQYNKIRREYDRVQFQNKHLLDRHYEEVYQQIPEVKQLDADIVTLSIQQARQALLTDRYSIGLLKEQIEDISRKKRALLRNKGFPDNYLDPIYTCHDCKDTGYINHKPCRCFQLAIVDVLYAQSNIRHLLEIENFNYFQYDYYPDNYTEDSTGMTPRDNIQRAVHICKSFINHFDSDYNNLFIYGNTGVGKTFLTHCVAKELIDHYHTVIYLTSFQFFDILEKHKFHNKYESPESADILSYILECDLLIIDDLGTELVNSFTASQLFFYINERHIKQKSTMISTNLSLDELNGQYSERVFSRITSHYILLKITGDDIRLKKAFQP